MALRRERRSRRQRRQPDVLIASARLHKLDPEDYLRDIFRVLPHWPKGRYLELAPKYWAATRGRLDPRELTAEVGTLTIPAPITAPAEQNVADWTNLLAGNHPSTLHSNPDGIQTGSVQRIQRTPAPLESGLPDGGREQGSARLIWNALPAFVTMGSVRNQKARLVANVSMASFRCSRS